jgi:hypothetical protein
MMKPLPENPGGFWEHQQLTDVNDEILARLGGNWDEPPVHAAGWEMSPDLADLRLRARGVIEQDFGAAEVWGWKDPRTCLTLPFWQHLVPRIRYVMCVRNPIDVAHSLSRRNGLPFEKGVDLWLTHVRSALAHTAGQQRCVIFYEDVMKNWRHELRRLATFLELPELSEGGEIQAEVEEFVKDEFQNHRTSIAGAVDEVRLAFPAKALYLVLRMYASPRHGECREQGDVDSMLHAALDRFSEYSVGARAERRDREAELQVLQEELSRRGHQLEMLLHSRSWKLTAPLRRVYSVLRSRNQGSI